MAVALSLFVGPERVPESARKYMQDLIMLLVGMVSGYLAGRTNGKG
jgi:hypothetical protein